MSELKDENKDLRSKLDKIDMDEINKQLRKLDELRDQMKEMTKLMDKMSDLDDFKSRLDDLQSGAVQYDTELSRLNALPAAEDIVTWPGLEDGLNGVRGEFAAYRPDSRAARPIPTETRATAMTPTPTLTPPAPTTSAVSPGPTTSGASTPTPQSTANRPASRSSSRPRSAMSEGPSEVMVDGLEKLGTVNKRHEELKKRVDALEKELQNKANKDEVSGKLPDDLMSQIESLSSKLAELDDLRAKDAGSIRRAQKAISDLQEELNNLQKLVDFLNKENDEKTKVLKKLEDETARLELTKAGKDYVDAELDVKADKSQVDGKVNRSLFDATINDLQKIIDDLLAKLNAYEEAWKQAHAKIEEDVDGKIDRTELDRLKAYLDRKLKDLNAKLKQNPGMFNPFCEDAAGLKKQMLPFNCLSCDKPVVVSNPSNPLTQSSPGGIGDAFTANKSSRPYTTFELDQIRQHAKSLLNADYVMDYYSMPRSAGGSHTMTYPHKRMSKQAYRDVLKDPAEDIPPEVFLPVKDEAEIVGADGHVYRGRFDVQSTLEPGPVQDGRPTTPSNSRPRTSPGKRPGSSRPGNMARPKTAVVPRVSIDQERSSGLRERPSSARDRPASSIGMNDQSAINDPVTVTIETVADLEPPPTTQPIDPDARV
ncbi:glutamine-rich protein 2-like isoform X2 [Watersipora subatra]|uniref:glutamine-rich protein 2-like isoform X2 n=1 Tax=Watersipora subatra TaxID=2589382 RepID=UPI00355C6EA9